jgi:hypothetical protein
MEAYTYALICDQLKRISALLRTTAAMVDLIDYRAMKSIGPWRHALQRVLPTQSVMEQSAKLPELFHEHPLYLAAQEEYKRIAIHLFDIRSATPEMASRARRGLLDLLRNTIMPIWGDKTEAATKVQRTVVNSMMETLRSMNSSTKRMVQFKVFVTQAEREWVITWILGQPVRINNVIGHVSYSTTDISRKLGSIVRTIVPKYHRI